MRSPFIVSLAVLCAASCGREKATPVDVESTGPAFAFGRDNGTVTVPMQVQADLEFVVDQSAPALAACDPRPGIAVGTGGGEATHMGRFEVVRMEHCSVDLAVLPPLLDGVGPFVWRAADGSGIHGTYAFLLLPPVAGGFFTLFVEGGTGRLEGATGRLEIDPRSTPVICVDPLCLNGATVRLVLTGSLSVPR